jgi:hypothetical protein
LKILLIALIFARVIAGETPGCPVEAKLAAAHVAANRLEMGLNGGWYGDADPKAIDVAVALYWQRFPDPTDGALYFIGPGDIDKMPWLKQRTGRWECAHTWVESWQ